MVKVEPWCLVGRVEVIILMLLGEPHLGCWGAPVFSRRSLEGRCSPVPPAAGLGGAGPRWSVENRTLCTCSAGVTRPSLVCTAAISAGLKAAGGLHASHATKSK